MSPTYWPFYFRRWKDDDKMKINGCIDCADAIFDGMLGNLQEQMESNKRFAAFGQLQQEGK
jgi:hypothetical protein